MTITAEPRKTSKTNPECRADRHAPKHSSYIKGCRCPGTVAAEEAHVAERGGRRRVDRKWRSPEPTNADCLGRMHTGTDAAWESGCRCDEAAAAHGKKLAGRRATKLRMRELGQSADHADCITPSHGTLYAFWSGCNHPESLRKHEEYKARKRAQYEAHQRATTINAIEQVRREWLKWRGPKMRVGRTSLWMYVRGMPDSPTKAEKIAAIAILSVRGQRGGLYDSAAIAARLGMDQEMVTKWVRERGRLRADRAARRLADVKWKAVRVAAAIERRHG